MTAKLLQDKVALITGGASGMGRASALVFARHGARVAIADIDRPGGEETIERVRQQGGQGLFVQADIAESTDVQRMIGAAISHFGRLDCAFNNAGIEMPMCSVAEIPDEAWDRLIRVNLRGAFLCMKHEILYMLRHGGGSIVNNASVAGLVGAAMNGSYVAAKHGVVGLTRTAAIEYARQGVRINVTCPGMIDTPMLRRAAEHTPQFLAAAEQMTPIGRVGQPEEVAELAAWLCSDRASFVVGQAFAADGGYVAQ
jgi:NAD(P)-dependent dehydrogenase (short-subunit alcohol dehydrogenase family)